MRDEQGVVRRALAAVVRAAGGGWTQKQAKHLRLVETMAIGAKKHLLLVSCDGERFLVGTGADGVQTMLRVSQEAAE